MEKKPQCEICGKDAKYLDVRNLFGISIKHYYCKRHVKKQPNGLPIGIPL
jgi:hypothetical protein